MSGNDPMKEREANASPSCPISGVESGGPVIGLGLLAILFGAFPFFPGIVNVLPLPLSLVFIAFGLFLVWMGIRK